MFFEHLAKPPTIKKRLDASFEVVGEKFESRRAHDKFFQDIITPKSNRWAFSRSGKTATSTALDLLFQLEFGCRNNAALFDPSNINRSQIMHETVNAGVFRPLCRRADISDFPQYFNTCTYIATVRHPLARAWSSFRYLCKSNEHANLQFALERIRLSAAVGFDWTEHMYTRDGFVRFLNYVQLAMEHKDKLRPDNHWRPQWMDIRPDVFRPNIVGRTEALDQFVRDLSGHFDYEFVGKAPHLNAGDDRSRPDWLENADITALVGRIYERDFIEFGYDL